MNQRVVVGISGASGAIIGVRIVELLAELGTPEVHLVVSPAGERTLECEAGADARGRLQHLAICHAWDNVGASIASGSFRTLAMIIAPCSIHTLSAIATGAASNLLLRSADVHLKERRRLVLLVRETPLHLGHIRAMAAATEQGAIIAPPVPAFYLKRDEIHEMVDDMARRAIALTGIDIPVTEWIEGLRPERLEGPTPHT